MGHIKKKDSLGRTKYTVTRTLIRKASRGRPQNTWRRSINEELNKEGRVGEK